MIDNNPGPLLIVMGLVILAFGALTALIAWDLLIFVVIGGWAALYLIIGLAIHGDDRSK